MAEKLYHRDGQWCIVCDSEQEADAILACWQAHRIDRLTRDIRRSTEHTGELFDEFKRLVDRETKPGNGGRDGT